MLPTRLWKPSLAAGLLLVGADGVAFGQQPTAPAVPSPAQACYSPGGVLLPASPYACKAMERGSILHPRDFPTAPFGQYVSMHFQTHVTNGLAARMALHDYDFVPGTDRLNYRGKDRVRQIASVIPFNAFPVVVERLPADPRLAEGRRAAVLTELAAILGHVPAERVVVGPPAIAPLQGVEAELVYNNLLRLTESAGTVPSTGVRSGSSGTFSSFGTGGTLGAPASPNGR